MNHFWGHPIYLFIRRFKTIMRCRRLRKRPCQDDQHLLVDTALLWLPLLDLRTHPDSVSSVRRRPRGPRSCCRAASHIGSASLRSGNITPSAKHQIPNGHGTGQEPEIVVFKYCVSENVPTLASYGFNKRGLILIVFGKQHQHAFKNDAHIQLSLFLRAYLLYLLLNSCDGNDSF